MIVKTGNDALGLRREPALHLPRAPGLLDGGVGRRHLLVRADGFLRVDGGQATQPDRSWAWRPTPSSQGYWLVASDGGIFAFGDAGFHGSTGNIRLTKPVVGMAVTPDGGGYWLVASRRRDLRLRRRRVLRVDRATSG